MQKQKKVTNALYDPDAVASRKERDRGTSEVNITERIISFSRDALNIPVKDRVGFKGQNNSRGIGPVPVADSKTALKSTWGVKKKLLGQSRRVGGPCQEGPAAEPRKDMEILFYHAMSDEWYK